MYLYLLRRLYKRCVYVFIWTPFALSYHCFKIIIGAHGTHLLNLCYAIIIREFIWPRNPFFAFVGTLWRHSPARIKLILYGLWWRSSQHPFLSTRYLAHASPASQRRWYLWRHLYDVSFFRFLTKLHKVGAQCKYASGDQTPFFLWPIQIYWAGFY